MKIAKWWARVIFDVDSLQNDDDVKELEGLRSQSNASKDVVSLTEELEDSLKKLHETNSRHKTSEEKPPKVRDCNVIGNLNE